MTQEETIEVSELMTKHEIPCDTVWLDIEYTEEKKYFTWDHKTFPEAKKMLETLVEQGRKLITIIDPHVKKDDGYFLFNEIIDKKLYVMEPSGESPYFGWCWPRTSLWIDFMNPEARELISSLYVKRPAIMDEGQLVDNYIFSNPNVHIWNDMNEPACFDPFEKSMAKANLHTFSRDLTVEHRDVHNLYGYYNT